MSKDYCRDFINSKKKFLNLSALCRECDVKQPHLSQFLKGPEYDMFMTLDKLEKLVSLICDL